MIRQTFKAATAHVHRRVWLSNDKPNIRSEHSRVDWGSVVWWCDALNDRQVVGWFALLLGVCAPGVWELSRSQTNLLNNSFWVNELSWITSWEDLFISLFTESLNKSFYWTNPNDSVHLKEPLCPSLVHLLWQTFVCFLWQAEAVAVVLEASSRGSPVKALSFLTAASGWMCLVLTF